MKKILFITLMAMIQVSLAEDEDAVISSPEQQTTSPSARGIPAMTPEQAKMLMEQLQQGHKLKEEQKKALEELDNEE